MSVYVDDMYKHPMGEFGRMKMSHMIADTHDELMEMVKLIGVNSRWIQQSNQKGEHFDICISMRTKAIADGAKQISMQELGQMTLDRDMEKYNGQVK